eukprot:Opistho-1_new@53869
MHARICTHALTHTHTHRHMHSHSRACGPPAVHFVTLAARRRTPIEIEVFLETLGVESSDNYLEYTENTGVAFRALDLRSPAHDAGGAEGTVGVYIPGDGVVFGFEPSVHAILKYWRSRLKRRKSLADMHGILPTNDDKAGLSAHAAAISADEVPKVDGDDKGDGGAGAGTGFKRDSSELSIRSRASENSIRSGRKDPTENSVRSFKRDSSESSLRSARKDASENSYRKGADGKAKLSRRKSEELTRKILMVPTAQDCARVFGALLSHHASTVIGAGKSALKARESCAEQDSRFGAKFIAAPRYLGKGPDAAFENFVLEFFTESNVTKSPQFSRTIISVRKDKISVDTRRVGQLGFGEFCGAKCSIM